MKSYALTEDRFGTVVLHHADCVLARLEAELGYPVMTLYDCERAPDLELEHCSCMKDDE